VELGSRLFLKTQIFGRVTDRGNTKIQIDQTAYYRLQSSSQQYIEVRLSNFKFYNFLKHLNYGTLRLWIDRWSTFLVRLLYTNFDTPIQFSIAQSTIGWSQRHADGCTVLVVGSIPQPFSSLSKGKLSNETILKEVEVGVLRLLQALKV
jgi:hypothetical protein